MAGSLGGNLVRGINVGPVQRMFINMGVAQGMSGVDILNSLTAVGMGIRREVGYALIREAKGIQTAGRNLNNVGLNRFFSPQAFSPTSADMKHPYIIYTRTTIQWHDTGVTEQILTSRYYSEIPTRQQHLDNIRGSVAALFTSREGHIENIEITGAARDETING